MRIILLGCPGAGKGTQAKFISAKYQIPQISTGDILRKAIEDGSELGKKVKHIMDSGQLVPDDVVVELVKERIKQQDCSRGFLLDGFPRTIQQAEALQKITDIDFIIDIEVPEEEVIRRLSGRRIHPASGRIYHIINNPPKIPNKDDITGDALIQRPDDSEETIRKRLNVYREQTAPLKDFYLNLKRINRNKPFFITLNGTDSVEEIKQEIFSVLEQKKQELWHV